MVGILRPTECKPAVSKYVFVVNGIRPGKVKYDLQACKSDSKSKF